MNDKNMPREYVIKTGWKYWIQCQEELFKLGKKWSGTGVGLFTPYISEINKKGLMISVRGDYLTYFINKWEILDEIVFTYEEWAKKVGITMKEFCLE